MGNILNVAPRSSSRLEWRMSAESRNATIDLFDAIGDPFEGTMAKDFVAELRDLDVDDITLNVNSPGGFVDDALAIYDAILNHPAYVTAHITVAASAASFVVMAADRRVITKNGKIQIHDAHGWVDAGGVVNATAIQELIGKLTSFGAILDEESDNISRIYAEHTKTSAEKWREAMKANGPHGTVYRGQEAVDAGLADEVAAPSRNEQPARVAALVEDEPTPVIDLAAAMKAARLQPPTPDLERLLEGHPLSTAFKGA